VRDAIVRMFQQRPFEPFTILMADGRTMEVRHPEQGSFGKYADSIIFFHPNRQVEFVNPELVVSFRTLRPVDLADYTVPEDPSGDPPADE
jgi:hypothetical protein